MNQKDRSRLYDRIGRYGAVIDAARTGQLSPRESLAALAIVHRVLRQMSGGEETSSIGRESTKLTEHDCIDASHEERSHLLRASQR